MELRQVRTHAYQALRSEEVSSTKVTRRRPMEGMTVTVKLTITRAFWVRWYLGRALLRLSFWVLGPDRVTFDEEVET